LSRLIPGRGKSHPVKDIVKTALEEEQEVRSRDPFMPFSEFVITTELVFQKTIHSLDLLLLPELQLIVRELSSPPLAVLARWIGSALISTLISIAAIALEKQLQVFSPAQPA
jgi:hypothetical protein